MSEIPIEDVKTFQEQVKKGDVDGVRAALTRNPALLNATNESGQSAFLLAKYYRQPEIANYLLSLQPRLSVFDASAAGETRVVLEQIDRDPELLEARSSDGWTPLHLAVFFGHPALASALLDRGAPIEARSTNAMRNTPLHAAAAGGDTASVKLLLERGADVNATQHAGWTALHSAAQNGNRELVETLLAHGAQVNLRAENNQSALDLALLHGRSEIASLFDQLGAKLQ
jgi:uncharacterized protein